MVCKSCLATLGSANSFGIWVCGLTSKGQVGVLLGSTGGGCCTWLFHIKQKILCTTACFPVSPQRGINYPPTYVGPPFLSRKELRFANFLFVSICILSFYKRIVRFVPAIPLDCTVPRIRSGFLLSKDKVLSLLATSLLNRNPYGFPINGSPVF